MKNLKEILKKLETKYPEDVVAALNTIAKTKPEDEEYIELFHSYLGKFLVIHS
mgnify:CR=1 FL=1